MIENWDDAIVLWTLQNRQDQRIVHISRKVTDPAPCDNAWEILDVDYIDVELPE